MKRVLIAGATGYLGKYVLKKFKEEDCFTRALVRNPQKLSEYRKYTDEIFEAEITGKETLKGCCDNIDVVFTSVGITRQQDNLTYMDVDYRGNLNLLEEAKKAGVKKFVYVSVLNGDKLRHLKICEAKEKFVDELKNSGLDYSIIRPNGFFSDMTEFYNMATKGRVYLFGDGELRSNPIHGEDLAEVCYDAINNNEKEIPAGGPQTLTQNEIAKIALEAAGKKVKITRIPDLVRRVTLKAARLFMNEKKYGPVEFFLTVMGIEMIAPEYGKHTLKEYYRELQSNEGRAG